MASNETAVAPVPPAPAYFARTVAPVQIAIGVASGLLVALILVALDSGLWPFALAGFVLATASGVFLGVVSLTVDGDQVLIGQGRAEREPRMVYVGEIAACEPVRLTWPQCFGIGMPKSWRVTGLAVRRGPTLSMRLTDGELVRVSVPDPEAAIAAMGRLPSPVTPVEQDLVAPDVPVTAGPPPAELDALLVELPPETPSAAEPAAESAPASAPVPTWTPPPAPPSRQPPPQRPRPRPRPR